MQMPLKNVRVFRGLKVLRSPESLMITAWMQNLPMGRIFFGELRTEKKDPLVIPHGLAWSKIGKFEKGDYGALFAEWSNPIMSMAPTKLAAVKQRMNAIERFIKSRNDNLSEDSVAKQSVEKEIESSDGKPDSAISNVFIGEISCQNLVKEQLQSRDMCIQSFTNQFRPESSISDVLNGELSIVETSKNEALSEEFDPKEYDKNVDESGDGKVSKSEIINVLTGQVSCDKYIGGFYDGESSKLYYTDLKEYLSSSMIQLPQAAVPEQTSSQMLAYTPVDLNLPNLNESFTESQV
ncbi:transposase, MuDR, MULE transposase domain protein, partial [Tanacetum coccineum]